jgi:hypothetical protein
MTRRYQKYFNEIKLDLKDCNMTLREVGIGL